MSKSMVFTGLIENVDDNKNSTFKEVSIRVHGLGKNNNGSNITDDAYKNAKESLLGVPIVAKYTEEVDVYGENGDLTEHNTIVVKDKNGDYRTKYDTVPLGFVSFDADITTEDVEEKDGRVRTYIKVDKVILWKRYEATEKITEWLESGVVPKVSMEIGDVGGKVQDGYFQIDSFEYRAICALGSDVTPCFDKAEILEFEKQDFNTLYQEMINEYSKEGGEEMAKKTEETNDTTVENEDFTVGENTNNTATQDFGLSNNNLEKEIRKSLSERKIEITRWGDTWTENEFYLRDIKDNVSIVIDNDWSTYYGIPFTVSGDVVTLDYEAKVEYIADWRPKTDSDETASFSKDELTDRFETIKVKVEEKFALENKEEKVDEGMEDFKKEFEALKDTVKALQSNNEELSNYKASKEKEELKQEVDAKVSEFELADEEVSEIREQAYSGEISVSQFEKELFALMGKKALEQRKEFTAEKVESGAKMKVPDNSTSKPNKSVYGECDKYFNKNN